jgi:hypothetical protein
METAGKERCEKKEGRKNVRRIEEEQLWEDSNRWRGLVVSQLTKSEKMSLEEEEMSWH